MTDATEKQKLIDLYRAESKAVVEHDISTLNKILAPSMELRLKSGYIMSKIKWIDQVQNQEMKYEDSKVENIADVQIDGQNASLIGQNRIKGQFWHDKLDNVPLQAVVHFAKNNGEWQITKQEISEY